MKISTAVLSLLLTVSCVSGKEKTYTASTPAAPLVRSFLGISTVDSIDFIRWKLVLNENSYTLHCNYGIGKPNTNGFLGGGKKIELTGPLKKQKNNYILAHGTKTLKIAELNEDLLHLMNTEDKLLVGNGGWSYMLNNTKPSGSDQVSYMAKQTVLKDSMAFEGRTPCGVPGIIAPGSECYKLKWYIVLYGNAEKNEPGNYRVFGTTWRAEGGRTGKWKIVTGKNNQVIYELDDGKGKGFLYLLKLDENVLMFIGPAGKLLTGDEDFSYTLNRRF